MASEWEMLQLREACLKIGSGATPRGGKEAYKGGATSLIRPQPDSLDARFLRYVLVSHKYQQRLLAVASAGATRPALAKSMIEDLDVPSPPLVEQRAIAGVLGALDDKIELNRRMNATLEAMARALFQSWFVDFVPMA